MAPPPTFSPIFSAGALPTSGAAGTCPAPASVRLYNLYQQQQQRERRRLVAAGVKRRYRGTARKEAALADLIERKVAEATEACAGRGAEEVGCRVAWEEVSQAKADLRRRIAEGAHDPSSPSAPTTPSPTTAPSSTTTDPADRP